MALKPLVPADLTSMMEAGYAPAQQRAAGLNVGSPYGDQTFIQPVMIPVPEKSGVASLRDMYEQKRDVYRSILGDPEEQRSAAQSRALFTIANFGLQLAGATGGRVGASFGERLAQAAEGSQLFPTISAISQQQRADQQKFDLAALQAAETERALALKAAADLAGKDTKLNTDLYEVYARGPGGKLELLDTVNLKSARGVNRLNTIREFAGTEGFGLKLYKVGTMPEPDAASGPKVGDQRAYSIPPRLAQELNIPARGLLNPLSDEPLIKGSNVTQRQLSQLAESAKDVDNRFGVFTIGAEPSRQPTERVITVDLPEEGLFAGQRVDVDALTRLGVNVREVTTSPQSFDVFSNPTLLNKFAFGEDTLKQNLLIQKAIADRTQPTTVTRPNALGVAEQVTKAGLPLPAQWLSALKTRASLASSDRNIAMPDYWQTIPEEQKQDIPEFSRSGVRAGSGVPEVVVPIIGGAPDMLGGPVEIGGRVTPDLNSPEFNKFLFKDGDFQKQINTDSPQWFMIPGMADEEMKSFRDDITRVGGLGSAIPATTQQLKEIGRELGIGPGLDEDDRSFKRMRRILNNVETRALQIVTQAEGDQDRILKMVQDRLSEQVEGVKARTFNTDESTLNALQGIEDLFAASMQRLSQVLPEYGGSSGGYTEKQITTARSDLRAIRDLLSDVIVLRKAYEFNLGTYSTGAGGEPTDEGRKGAQDLLNKFNKTPASTNTPPVTTVPIPR